MLLAGAVSVWFFFLFLCRAAGYRAALIGAGLLATDTLYLLTVCFDWGPVALQHLLLLGGLVLLVGFYQTCQAPRLFWGCALLGLGIWDKALMIWMLGGIFVASAILYRKEILAVTTLRRLSVAALGFALGALPLIVYNVDTNLSTFRSNTSYDTHDIPGKARLLMATAHGGGLLGWLNNEDWQTPQPHSPDGAIESASAKISALARHPRRNLMLYAFIAALLLTPLARGAALRAILFALIAMIVAWLQMAITVNAGGSVHHAILIWPLPQMVIAISFAAASRRLGRAAVPVLAAALAVMMVAGLLVTNEYFALLVRNGGAQNWTDAIFRLSDYMQGTSAKTVYCVDWGILDSLRLLNRGKLPLRIGTDLVQRAQSGDDGREALMKALDDPATVFLAHTKEWEFFEKNGERFVNYAASAGFRREMLATINDSYGRAVYEVYRFAAAP
ncbi:MAG TPA: hypothetical protein VKE70_31215 [Candidatus Solibacter sp.]|nr:hypothetical protein [Candidatus Solibacter sp.]